MPLKERVDSAAAWVDGQALRTVVKEAILGFLSCLLGFQYEVSDPAQPMETYGLYSLNAMRCQFWCFRGMSISRFPRLGF